MPLYTLTTRAGVLTDAAKAKLAGELTTLHAEFSGVPRNWVHVVFQEYAAGNGFTAGEPSDALDSNWPITRIQTQAAATALDIVPDRHWATR